MRNDEIGSWTARGARIALLTLVMCACAGCREDDESAAVTDPPSAGQPPAPPIPPLQPSPGAATVEWLAPQTATDGSTLTNLAGYRIYYGTDVTKLTQTIDVANPGVLSYMIEGLTPATYYFAVTAINTHGRESARSNAGRKVIS